MGRNCGLGGGGFEFFQYPFVEVMERKRENSLLDNNCRKIYTFGNTFGTYVLSRESLTMNVAIYVVKFHVNIEFFQFRRSDQFSGLPLKLTA